MQSHPQSVAAHGEFVSPKKKGLPAIKVTTMDLNHTNGCVPSPELLRRQVVTIAWDMVRDRGKIKVRLRFNEP